MILEEYRARMSEELKKLDWQHPADKESSAYRLLSEASRDKQLSAQRLQQLAKALDGGVLITEDGAEFELYGGRV